MAKDIASLSSSDKAALVNALLSAGLVGGLGGSGIEALGRLKRAMGGAVANNPLALPAITTGITVTQSTTSDTTLTDVPLTVNARTLHANATNLFAWYGGVPSAVGGATASVAMPVHTNAPGNGNLQGYANIQTAPGTVSADMNQQTAVMEFMYDGATVELGFMLNNRRVIFFLVNGQYLVDKTTGWTGPNASNQNSFFKITGLPAGINRITAVFGCDSAAPAATFVAGVRIAPLSTVWKPSPQGVLRAAFPSDSFGEALGTLAGSESPRRTVQNIANAPMAFVMGQLLGIRDVRQFASGGTGYLADNNGTRSKLSAQIPKWLPQGPFDVIIVNHGYNDYAQATGNAAGFQAEVLADLQLMRAGSSAPIVVLGSQAGKRGPDANTLTIEARIKAAVEGFADPLCKFAPVSSDARPWMSGTGYVTATNGSGNSDLYTSDDGIHPSLAGHAYLGARIADAVRVAVNSMNP